LDIFPHTDSAKNPVDIFPFTDIPNDINSILSSHVETVVQLVRKKPDTYIDITVDMDELDLTSSEAKATYDEIKDYVFEGFGLKVSSLNIAQVKTKCGIIERENYNKPKSENVKQPQCTKDKEEAIMNALRHFKMI
jgi:ribosomal protein L23